MLVRKAILLLIFSYFTLFGLVKSETVSGALKRQSLIYHEPPFENNQERADQITEHFIVQRLDNFDHQNKDTFKMVRSCNFQAAHKFHAI